MKAKDLTLCLLLAATSFLPTYAQSFPDKPIKILVGFAAGGSTDLVTRIVAQHMASSFGQQLVVENKVEASGILATEALAQAQPDGYTLGACSTSAFAILP